MTRAIGAFGLLVALVVVEELAPSWFPMLVSIALLAGCSINWTAFWRLRERHQSDPTILSLRTAYFAAMFLAIASTSLAAVGLTTAARILNIIGTVPRETVLIGLSFPALLMTGPALDWLLTFRGQQ